MGLRNHDDWDLKYLVLACKASVEDIIRLAVLNFSIYTIFNDICFRVKPRNAGDMRSHVLFILDEIADSSSSWRDIWIDSHFRRG